MISWSKAKFLSIYVATFVGTLAVVVYVCSQNMDATPTSAGSPGDPNAIQLERPPANPMNSTEIKEIVSNRHYLMKILSVLLASVGLITNAVMIWVITTDSELQKRREMILPLHMAVVEILTSYPRFTYLVRWSSVTFGGETAFKATSVFCMATQQMILWLGADRVFALIVVNIAVDRFIAVRDPMRYGSLGKNYYRAHGLVIWGFYAWVIAACFALAFYNDSRFGFQNHISFFCHNGVQTYGYYFAQLVEVLRVIMFIGGTMLYLYVISTMRSYTAKQEHEAIRKAAMDRQARVTRTLSWVMVSTLLIDPIAPVMWFTINLFKLPRDGWLVFTLGTWSSYAGYISRANNLFIWLKTNDEFKRSLRKKLGLKTGNKVETTASNGPNAASQRGKSTMHGGQTGVTADY